MSTIAYESQGDAPAIPEAYLSKERPNHQLDPILLGEACLDPFRSMFHCITPRGAMFPNAPKADYKLTDQHGDCGVLVEVKEDTAIPDFKLSDIPGVRRAD